MSVLLVKFFLISAIIVYTGYQLTITGDKIADETGFGSNLIGFILLASVTSMPELVTSISAAKIHRANLVFGNMIGSNIFNMVVIALVVIWGARKSFQPKSENIFNASMGLFITALAGILVFVKTAFSGTILLAAYGIILYLSFKFEKKTSIAQERKPSFQLKKLFKSYVYFVFLSAVIVVSGYYLTVVCDKIAVTPFTVYGKTYILGATFVGQLFLAVSTSLPELIVSLSAVKIGKIDMAYSNIFGSNIFNMAILGLSSFFYKGQMFANVAGDIVFSIMIFFILVSITIGSLKYKTESKFRIDSFLLILFYFVNLFYVFSK